MRPAKFYFLKKLPVWRNSETFGSTTLFLTILRFQVCKWSQKEGATKKKKKSLIILDQIGFHMSGNVPWLASAWGIAQETRNICHYDHLLEPVSTTSQSITLAATHTLKRAYDLERVVQVFFPVSYQRLALANSVEGLFAVQNIQTLQCPQMWRIRASAVGWKNGRTATRTKNTPSIPWTSWRHQFLSFFWWTTHCFTFGCDYYGVIVHVLMNCVK